MVTTHEPLGPEGTARALIAREYSEKAYHLGFQSTSRQAAIEATFVTPQDPVLITQEGRLPTVPINEARELNILKAKSEGKDPDALLPKKSAVREAKDGAIHGYRITSEIQEKDDMNSPLQSSNGTDASLRDSLPPAKTNPLFPPLPMYGPPTTLRGLQSLFFRFSSSVLSLCFLGAIICGAIANYIPLLLHHSWLRLKGDKAETHRPFYKLEQKRTKARRDAQRSWTQRSKRRKATSNTMNIDESDDDNWLQEGGEDRLVCDIGYYARRVGLDVEEFAVQTEDGFILSLWHIFDPREYRAQSASVIREGLAAEEGNSGGSATQYRDGERRYPVLLVHGLLQSAGAYCCNDEDSLAFYLTKSGYDVWLGNNRCGFDPSHVLLKYGDPRMWAWNIRQMGVMDLPALVSRVLVETGFEKLGLVCHSQGTTQTFVALAKEQRPELGEKISVFCALAPAAYAGPLVKKMYFRFMRVITPGIFRLIFGIHAFIPFMMTMHQLLPARIYGFMGYLVFSFLFDWSDARWDRGLRNRFFQFSPVYVSLESMRWWLGRECFAKHKCILSTRDENRLEDEEVWEEDNAGAATRDSEQSPSTLICRCDGHSHDDHGRYAWYDERAPPFALWICGNDALVDGRRLLRRFERGREPHVRLVYSKIIEEYEHLDVIWAMDSIEKVGSEVKRIIWETAPAVARTTCRTPKGCDRKDELTGNDDGFTE